MTLVVLPSAWLHRGEMKRNPEKMMFFVLWYIFSERSRAIRRGCCFLMIGFRDWYSELGLYRLAVDCLLLKITCNSPLNTQKCNLNLWNLISYMLVITSGEWNWCANTHAIASCIKQFSTPHKFNQQLLSSIAALCPPTINPMHCSTMYCYSSEHHRIRDCAYCYCSQFDTRKMIQNDSLQLSNREGQLLRQAPRLGLYPQIPAKLVTG